MAVVLSPCGRFSQVGTDNFLPGLEATDNTLLISELSVL